MEVYATKEDLQKRWRSLSDVELKRADALLTDASVILATTCRNAGVSIDPSDELQSLAVTTIVCEMVKRAMLSPVDQAPMQQFARTAGSYSESGTYVNPTGDLYLTSAEKQRLGIGRQRMFSIQPIGGVGQ